MMERREEEGRRGGESRGDWEVRRRGGGQETDRMEGVEGIRRGEKSRLGEKVLRKGEKKRLRGGGEERRRGGAEE